MINIKRATLRELLQVFGGTSSPSKMPCYGWSIPASTCRTGSKLATVEGTTCFGCYALKGAYVWPSTQTALHRRYDILMKCEHDYNLRHEFVQAFAEVLNRRASNTRARLCEGKDVAQDGRYFRWFDSGDLQGVWHLNMIRDICELTPTVEHWLPTREAFIVREYTDSITDGHDWHPSNLMIRLSDTKVNGKPRKVARALADRFPYVTLSGVHTGPSPREYKACIAPTQNNECRDCRACWQGGDVSYSLH